MVESEDPATGAANMSSKELTVDAELEKLQRETFGYFWHETNPANGLVIDKTAADWPASIAATGPCAGCVSGRSRARIHRVQHRRSER